MNNGLKLPSSNEAKQYNKLNELATMYGLKGKHFSRKVIVKELWQLTTLFLRITITVKLGTKKDGTGLPRLLPKIELLNFQMAR